MKRQGDTAVFIACGLALLAVMTVAQAQGLPDPTRPPAAAIEVLSDAKGEPVPAASVQTIIQRQGARPAAVINGEYVELGGRVGDARVVRITDAAVTLRTDGSQEVLTLTPGIERTAAAAGKAADGGKTGKGAAK